MKAKSLNVEKAKAALLYILNESGGELDFIKLFKILYFADRKHLATYGDLIIQDRYIAMKNGPVPSMIFDKLKNLRDDRSSSAEFSDSFELTSNHFTTKAKATANLDYLSLSNIKCLQSSIIEHKNKSSWELSNISHDFAWENADMNNQMNIIDIAKAEGANEEMLNYITECFQSKNISFNISE